MSGCFGSVRLRLSWGPTCCRSWTRRSRSWRLRGALRSLRKVFKARLSAPSAALHLKYRGTDTSLEVPCGDEPSLRERFESAYRQRFAFTMPGTALIVESITLELIARSDASPIANNLHLSDAPLFSEPASASQPAAVMSPLAAPSPVAQTTTFMAAAASHFTSIFNRDTLRAGAMLQGPAILFDRTSTTVVEPGWSATVSPTGDLILERHIALPGRKAAGTDVDPITLEIFNNLFMSIAEQMGVALQSTAYSVNIKRAPRLLLRPVRHQRRARSPTRLTCLCIWAPWGKACDQSSVRALRIATAVPSSPVTAEASSLATCTR